MTDGNYEAWEQPGSAGGPDIELLERLVRLRWLLEQPLRLRITVGLLLYSLQNERPRLATLAAFLGEQEAPILEQLHLMRRQGVVAGTFWLHEHGATNGVVHLIPSLEEALPSILDALGAPSSNLPGPPAEVPDDDQHLRVPTGNDLITYAYYLLRQQGELGKTTTTIVTLGRLLAHPLRIAILVELIRNPSSTTDELAAAIEHDPLVTGGTRQHHDHEHPRAPVTTREVADRVRELADHCAIVPVPHRSGQWMLSDPMRAVFKGAHEYLVAIRELDEASPSSAPLALELPCGPGLN